ncbi:MAG: hypothetical protein JOZ36_07665 [Acidobacteria bacterium]|nr:hypothetical protein [Acidobacteriota bacterium]
MRQLASLLPQLPGIDSFKTYAAYPVWSDSTTAELTWPTVVKDAVVRWYHQARAWNAAKQAARRYGGTLGSSCMRVLESLIFDFQNYRTGELDPSYLGIAAKTGLGRSTVAVALARLKELRIIDWIRRCEHHWKNGRFELRQRTNAYVLLPPSQWLGLDPQPAEAPVPETGTWGDHPPLPDAFDQAIDQRKQGASIDTTLTILEEDTTNPVALAMARLFRSVLARETAAKPLQSSEVRISD